MRGGLLFGGVTLSTRCRPERVSQVCRRNAHNDNRFFRSRPRRGFSTFLMNDRLVVGLVWGALDEGEHAPSRDAAELVGHRTRLRTLE